MAANSNAIRPLNFTSSGGVIKCDNKRVNIKGINWFGPDTDMFCLHGLWKTSFSSMLKVIRDNKFNAVRIPISVECIEKLETQMIQYNPDADAPGANNADFKGMKASAFFDRVLTRFASAGILVMFSLHNFEAGGEITPLWYDDKTRFKEDVVKAAWITLVNRFKRHWNFFAADLKNEPHGDHTKSGASWGDGSARDWRKGAELLGKAILSVAPRLLIFVEGIEGWGTEDGRWGGHLTPVYTKGPPNLPADRLVYSPHVYGPSIWPMMSFRDSRFPRNMPAHWEYHWAFLKTNVAKVGSAMCIGEWGGRCHDNTVDSTTDDKQGLLQGFHRKDLVWHRALAEFLVLNDIRDTFLWSFNANDGHTGGLVKEADWVTVDNPTKLQVINYVCPNPTSFVGGKAVTPATPQPTRPPWTPVLPELKAMPKDRAPKQPARPGANTKRSLVLPVAKAEVGGVAEVEEAEVEEVVSMGISVGAGLGLVVGGDKAAAEPEVSAAESVPGDVKKGGGVSAV